MRVLINAISAKMGGASNYLKEIAIQLASRNSRDEFVFLLPPERIPAIQSLFPGAEVIGSNQAGAGVLARLWFDQITLRRMIREKRIDCLFSSADFGMLKAPCRQVLLVRNSVYFFAMYLEQYGGRRPWKARLSDRFRRWLVCRSVTSADFVMTPSRAMLDELCRWVTVPETKGFANYYGVSHSRFSPRKFQEQKSGPWNLLFVSLYTDHKNLGTLLRGLEVLTRRGEDVHLSTTADPHWPAARITQSWVEDARLADSPLIRERVHFVLTDAAAAPKNLYAACDIFVYPSVVESFGHALAEAMSSGLPIIAADVATNRELCGSAALYFSPFDPGELAARVQSVIADPVLRRRLGEAALTRSRLFRWEQHVDVLLGCLKGEMSRFNNVVDKGEEALIAAK
ncbi:MAG: glycosyltransferase family 4 protein [Acidobacteriia bacterium]|nr:glycosyltransferase family 4 protein [Terriglobia bacterium]